MNLSIERLRSGAPAAPGVDHELPEFGNIDVMFDAALARLMLTGNAGFAGRLASLLDGDPPHMPADVLECLTDLEQLRTSIAAAADACRQTVADLRRELAAAQCDLTAMQTGEQEARYLARSATMPSSMKGSTCGLTRRHIRHRSTSADIPSGRS